MSIAITVGSITVTAEGDALTDPVVPHPGTEALTFSAFAEAIVKSGLAEVVFDAFPSVVNMAVPGSARVGWPEGYATDEPPFGRKEDLVTGVRQIQVIDDLITIPNVKRWTIAINAQAAGRKSYYDSFAETAVAIATGIKEAIETTFKAGRATLVAGTVTVSSENFSSSSEILVSRRTAGGTLGFLSLDNVSPGSPGSFDVISANAADTSVVSWFIAG